MKINKSEFIEELAAECNLPRHEAEEFVNKFIRLIYKALHAGHTVNLSGFGKFSVSHREPRIGIHPRTLKPMTIPELNTPKFVAGEAFKQAIALKK